MGGWWLLLWRCAPKQPARMYRCVVQACFLQSLRLFSCPALAVPEPTETMAPFSSPSLYCSLIASFHRKNSAQELLLVALQHPIHLFQCSDGETRSVLWRVSLTLQASNAHERWPLYAQSSKGSMRLEASMGPHQGWSTDLPIQHNFLRRRGRGKWWGWRAKSSAMSVSQGRGGRQICRPPSPSITRYSVLSFLSSAQAAG